MGGRGGGGTGLVDTQGPLTPRPGSTGAATVPGPKEDSTSDETGTQERTPPRTRDSSVDRDPDERIRGGKVETR